MAVDSTVVSICQGQKVLLHATGTDEYAWSPATGLSDAQHASPIAEPAVTTTYTVTGTDAHHCFTDSLNVTVQVNPNPQFDIADSLIVTQKGELHILTTEGTPDIINWSWSPVTGLNCANCPEPVSTALQTTTYTAMAFTEHGCSDTDRITIYVLCNESKIYIPTAFTPNGDGKNDWFYVMSSIENPVVSFAIYSRNGEQVFYRKNSRSNNPTQGWDGMYNGFRAAPGVYVYRIDVLCNDNVVPFTGTVTVLR